MLPRRQMRFFATVITTLLMLHATCYSAFTLILLLILRRNAPAALIFMPHAAYDADAKMLR